MCNMVYFSTSSDEDLSLLGSKNISFGRISETDPEEILALLSFPNQWYLTGRHGGCSCHFRHALEYSLSEDDDAPEPEFLSPQDWNPEDAENIEDTLAAFDKICDIVTKGHSIDLVDWWNGTDPEDIRTKEVKILGLPREEFRFFENYKFNFS